MSLTKSAIVTVTPAVIGQPGYTASLTCQPLPTLPDTNNPSLPGGGTSGGSSGVSVPAGTPILLEDSNGSGGYTSYTGVAPAPAGFVCRREVVFVNTVGSTAVAVQYNIVCTRG